MFDTLKRHIGFVIFFICLCFVEQLCYDKLPELRMLLKGAICASLLVYYIVKVPPQNKSFILALIFAMAGDLFLIFDNGKSFEIGLSCFLIMQLLYIAIFRKAYIKPNDKKSYLFILLLLLTYLLAMWYILPVAGSLALPVAVYGMALTVMVFFAFSIKSIAVRNFIFCGSVLFLISDAILGLGKFTSLFQNSRSLVMSTYGLAQLMITLGMIKSYEIGKPKSNRK